MKKNYFLTLILTLFISGLSFGQIINEFEPNAAGTEPANISLELKGTPGTSFTGYFLSVESDGNNGLVDRSSDVSGTFDSNGLLNVTIPDLENPSFTVILCSENVAIGTDLDSNNNGTPDNSSVLGIVYDAIGVPDSSSDAATLYGADLGGVDFPYLGNEPEIVFRDGVTDDLYSKNTLAGSVVYDILGNDISVLGTFDIATTATTFGSVNPTYTLATSPVILTGNLSGNLSYESGSGPSTEGTFTVEGTNLTNDILLSSPSDFEISETLQGTFSSSISLSEGGTGSISETTIYVRLKASLAIDDYSGDITITSTGADTKTISLSGSVYAPPSNSLVITGAYDGPLSQGTPKGIELYVVEDITDLSIYGISSVSNGGGSSAGFVEYNFPADAVTAGTYIYLATESTQFNTFFGIDPTYVNGVVSINGDDSIELYEGGAIIDTFGDVVKDGSGEAWDYLDGWAYRKDGTGPEGTTFTSTNWTYSGVGALVGQSDNASATTPFPIGSYSNATAGVRDNSIAGFSTYPNPVRGNTLTVTTSSTDIKTVNIFNVLGRKVFSQRFSSMTKIMNVSEIASGVYIMKVTEGNNIATKKLIIE